MGKAIGCLFPVMALILAISLTVACVARQNAVKGDVSSWLDRAQVSADASDMAAYLAKLTAGMKEYSMTEGHAALLWKRPDNDMGLIYDAATRLQARAEQQARLLAADPSYRASTTYQVALDDLRGASRELTVQDLAWYWRHDGLMLITGVAFAWAVLLPLSLLSIVVGAVWDDRD